MTIRACVLGLSIVATGLLGIGACGGSSAGGVAADAGPGPAPISVEAGPDAPPPCDPSLLTCSGVCIDPKIDSKNCGSCGVVCGPDTTCSLGKCQQSTTFAVQTIHLGEADRQGVKNKDGWKSYGENIDGLVTSMTNTTSPDLALVCKRAAGAPSTVHDDGTDGIDNTWGKEMMKLLDPFTPVPSKNQSDQIAQGGMTALVTINGYKQGVNATGLSGSVTFSVPTTVPAPKWDGADVRKVDERWTKSGTPVITFTNGTMTDGKFDSGVATVDVPFQLTFGDGVSVPMKHLRVRMTISGDGIHATEGIFSGFVVTEDMVTAIKKYAGYVSTDLCSGSTVESIAQSVRQSSDLVKTGTQDPAVDCDAISVGLGFEATRVVLGGIAPSAQPVDPCK